MNKLIFSEIHTARLSGFSRKRGFTQVRRTLCVSLKWPSAFLRHFKRFVISPVFLYGSHLFRHFISHWKHARRTASRHTRVNHGRLVRRNVACNRERLACSAAVRTVHERIGVRQARQDRPWHGRARYLYNKIIKYRYLYTYILYSYTVLSSSFRSCWLRFFTFETTGQPYNNSIIDPSGPRLHGVDIVHFAETDSVLKSIAVYTGSMKHILAQIVGRAGFGSFPRRGDFYRNIFYTLYTFNT